MKFLSYLRKQTGAAPLVILEVLGIAGVVIATSYYITTVAVNNVNNESSQAIEEVKDGGLAEGSVSLDKLSDSVFLTGTTDSGDITSATIQDAIVTVGSLDKNIFTITYPDNTTAKVSLGNGVITDFHLKDGSVTTVKILDNAVTTAKLSDGSVTTIKILDGAITAGKLANGAVTTQNILDGTITSSKLQDGVVTSSILQDNAVTTSKLTDQAVTAAKIATGTITGSQVASDGSIAKSLTAGDGITVTNNNNGTFTITNSRIDAWQRIASTATLQPTTANDNINLGSGNYLTTGSFNHLSLNTNSTGDGFNIIGGSSNSRTLTINGNNVTLNQSLQTTDTPTFAGLTIDTLTGMLKATNGILAVATADTDYQRPVTWSNGLTYTTGTAGIDYNTTNLKLTSGKLNTIQDLTTSSSPTFATVQATTSITLQDPGSGTNTITMQAPTLASSYTLTLPTTDGNNGEYLKTDGDGNLSWATSTTNQLVQSFTAATGESITAGDVVSLVNGEVKKGANATFGSEAVASATGQNYYVSAEKIDNTRFIMTYHRVQDSSYIGMYNIIGEVNGTTITYGTESQCPGSTNSAFSKTIVMDSSHFVTFYSGYAVVGTYSGTSITSYGPAAINGYIADNSYKNFDAERLDSTHFVMSYLGYTAIGTINDTSISFGNTYSPSGSSSNYGAEIGVLDGSRFVIVYSVSGGLYIVIGNISSGTVITFGSPVNISVPSTTVYYPSLAVLDSSHIVINYTCAGGVAYSGYISIGTITGATINFGLATNYATGNISYFTSIETINPNNFVLTYFDTITGDNYLRAYSRSDTTIYEADDGAHSFGIGSPFNTLAVLSAASLVFDYTNSSSYPAAIVRNAGIPIGIAKTPATGGNAIDVILSGVSDNYSGLTVGTAYYANADGSLTTTTTNNKAGLAISTTELLLDYASMGADQYFNDVVFNNDFRITEATDYAGLIFKNQLGSEILNMQENGDLNVSNNISAQSLAISGDTVITGNTSVSGSMTLDNISPTTSLNISLGTDAGDDLIVGNNNTFIVKGDTDNVGIGTANPTAKLDITTQDTNDTTGLVVNQQDLDQIAMQLSSSTNATATMFDLATNNTSGNLINLDWDNSTQASGNIIGTNLDYTNLTPTNDSANYLYGIHIKSPATNNDSNSYALYIEGTSWDKGIVSDAPIQTNSSFILQDSNSQTNTITVKSPTLASSYTLTLPTTVGSAGQYLTTDGEGNLSWKNTASTQIDQQIITDTASSSITFDGLNGDNYYEYELSANLKNNSGETVYYALVINSDETASNYQIQYQDTNGTNVNVGNANDNYIVALDNGDVSYIKIIISKDINNYIRAILQGTKGTGTNLHNLSQTIVSTNTIAKINSIGIKSIKVGDLSTVSAIATGSEIVLTGSMK